MARVQIGSESISVPSMSKRRAPGIPAGFFLVAGLLGCIIVTFKTWNSGKQEEKP